MAVRDMRINNAVLQSRQAERISLNRVSLRCDAKPVMQFQNSRHVIPDTIRYPAATELLATVTGNRSTDIRLRHADTSEARQEISLGGTAAAGSCSHQ